MPFIRDEEIYFLYSVSPLRLYHLNQTNGKCTLVKEMQKSERATEEFRGSASPVPYRGGWLCTLHQVDMAQPRKYLHRLAWFDNQFTDFRYSDVFLFHHSGIEFNLGVLPTPHGVAFTYSWNDDYSSLGFLPEAVVNQMLHW
jgi:hypothetical protein